MTTTGTITSQGIGSGLDVSGIITKLMAVEQQPLTSLDKKEVTYEAKLTAFGTLKGAFSAVQSAVEALNSPLLFKSMTATPGDSSVLSASANTAASAGDYTIDVVARAQGQTIASQGFSSLTDKIDSSSGKLKIELGTFANNAFTADGTKSPVTVTIPANSSLNGVRDAINSANAGVTARIVDVGGGSYKLLISSNSSGATNSMRITAEDSSGNPLPTNNTGLAKLSFNNAPATIDTPSFASASPVAGVDGKLRITLGSASPVTVNIASGSTLSDIRDAITNANAGVTATIVDLGGGNSRLSIAGNSANANASLSITALDSSGAPATDPGLAQFTASAESSNQFDITVAAQDAHIKINNLDVYRTTNTISDAITGVTLSLTKLGTTGLTVAKNTAGVGDAVDAFVKAYNTAAQQVRQLSAYDTSTNVAAALNGDAGARAMQTALGDMLDMTMKTQSSSISGLADIGVTVQRDGTLAFDTSKLDSALSADSTAVAQLITSGYNGTSGIGKRMTTLLDGIMDDQNGVLANSTNGVNQTIKDIDDRRTTLKLRLAQIQSNYEAQFSAMDSFVASWNQTSSYLTQQLSALNGSSNNSKG